MAARRGTTMQQRGAATIPGHAPATNGENNPVLSLVRGFFGSSGEFRTLLKTHVEDILKDKTKGLEDKLTILTDELAALKESLNRANEKEPADDHDNKAFTGNVRTELFSILCEDSFFPSINQLSHELLEVNHRLDGRVVGPAAGYMLQESFLEWQTRNKKEAKRLPQQVRQTKNMSRCSTK